MKRFSIGLAAILMATTTSVLASGVPVSCDNGTRNEPQPPTIIPAWIEEVPDIQHDGWIEVTPDIYHPEQVIPNPDKKVPLAGKFHWDKHHADVCVYQNGRRAIGLKADCLTPNELSRSLVPDSGGGFKLVAQAPTIIDAWTEEVPDIEHEAWTEEVPDIEHPEQVIPNPDKVIDTKTVKYFTGFDRRLQPVYQYVTSDGTCPRGL